MNNRGLKSYTKQFIKKIGAITTCTNLNKDDANMHIQIPIIKTRGANPFSTSLIYNYQDRNVGGIFGNGQKLNFFAQVIDKHDHVEIKNADGSIDSYNVGVVNDETQQVVNKVYYDNYQISAYYEVEDKYGNKKTYQSLTEYPAKIAFKNGDALSLNFISTDKTISNGYGDVVKFVHGSANRIDRVEYLYNNKKYESVKFGYTDNNLTSIEYRNENDCTIAKIMLIYNTNNITIIDTMSDYRVVFTINQDTVTTIEEGFGSTLENKNTTRIVYDKHKTTVSEGNKAAIEYYFDSDGIPLYQMDSDGFVIETEFDSKTKLLMAQSSPFLINGTQKNYFKGTMEDFTLNGVTREKVAVNNSKWETILGKNVYKFTHSGKNSGYVSYEVPIDCVSSDSITVIIWGRQKTNYTNNSFVRARLHIGSIDEDKFKKPIVDDEFELMLLGVNCTRTERTINISIEFVGDVSIELGGIQILKQDFGAFYEYDSKNNATLISKSGESIMAQYNANSKPQQVTGVDSTIQTHEYNNRNNPVKSTSAYGVEITNEYHSQYPELITKQTLCNKENTKIVEMQKEYTSDGRSISKEYDELGNCIASYSYQFDRLIKAINAMGSCTEFKYTNDSLISDIILSKDNAELAKASYVYNDKRQLTSVTLKNGSIYEFVYNAQGKVVAIKLNGIVVFSYVYIKGRVTSQMNGESGDGYEFEYDDMGQLAKVSYVDSKGNKSLRFNYLYNDLKQLVKVSDGEGNILATYVYDVEGNISKISNSDSAVEYSYDNLKTINNVSRTVKGKTIHESFEGLSRSQSAHPKKLLSQFSAEKYLGLFESDAVLKMGDITLSPCSTKDFVFGREGALPYLDLKYSQTLAYKLTDRIVNNTHESGCIKFWFKPKNVLAKKYIFGTKAAKGRSYYSVFMQNGKLYLEVCEENGSPRVLFTSTYDVIINKWNYFALNFYYRADTYDYCNCEISLTLNADTKFFTTDKSMPWIDIATQPVYYIGHRYDGDAADAFEGKIACVNISPREYDTYTNIKKYYTVTKDYIDDCQFIDVESQSLDISETTAVILSDTTKSMFEVYPLHNSVMSTTGKSPTRFTQRYGVLVDKDKSFNFNNLAKRYAYVADGAELTYDFGQTKSGTVLMRVYTEVASHTQYLLEGKDISGNTLGLYRNSGSYLCIKWNGDNITTNLKMSNNSWHAIGLSFDKTITQSSLTDSVTSTFRVYLDGKTEAYTRSGNSFESLEFSIGRKFDVERKKYFTGYDDEAYPLYGQIEMLCASTAYCSENTLNVAAEDIKCITKTNEFDDFGMLKKSRVLNSGTQVLSKAITYKTRPDNKHISQRIDEETFSLKGQTLTKAYLYDNVGNLIQIGGTMHSNRSYEYDGRGFMTKEDATQYAYDANGNITQMGDTKLYYDSVIKDRLVKVGNTSITYDVNNPLMPSKYGDVTYTFEGRRLVGYSNSTEQFTYKYNEQGLRIEKKSAGGKRTQFFYNENRLITEIAPTHRLDFLYDENGVLYGFVKDNKDRYYYVRDYLQNILGIIDSTGQFVVKYNQTAYGKVTVIQDTCGISDMNPFRYKGYYYDQESGMYYCESRYYVPEWGRWLNGDTPNKLEILTPACMNLFGYCGNNPILRFDESGDSWKSFCDKIRNFGKKVGRWLKEHIGFSVVFAKEESVSHKYRFWYTAEEGVGYSGAYDNGKPLNFYIKLPDPERWWEFWEISVGFDVNINGYGVGVGLGMECSLSVHLGGNSLDLYANVAGRVGGQWSSIDSNGLYVYSQLEINFLEIAATVAVVAGIAYVVSHGGAAVLVPLFSAIAQILLPFVR